MLNFRAAAAEQRQQDYDDAVAEGERSRDCEVNSEWRWRLQTRRDLDRANAHLQSIKEAAKDYAAATRTDWDVFESPTAEQQNAYQARVNLALAHLQTAINCHPDTWEIMAEGFRRYRGLTPEGIWENEGGAVLPDAGSPF